MSNKRFGKIQKSILQWVTDTGYTYIGPVTKDHWNYGLGGRDLEEIMRSVNALVARGILKEHQPGFYSLPDWSRP